MMAPGLEAVVLTYAWLTRQSPAKSPAPRPKAPPARPRLRFPPPTPDREATGSQEGSGRACAI